ncbi:hypothetical protein [Streptomyces sp. AB3(2024)]|uniref:hypothetical protein n=1 Tax=Streptomyces sp. AB3(2024) TaxID=3317321 RepID=UPI0035A34DDE
MAHGIGDGELRGVAVDDVVEGVTADVRGRFQGSPRSTLATREYMRTLEKAPEALQRLLAPFMEQLTRKTLGNAVELMSEDERSELERLLGLMIEPPRRFTAYTF